MAPLMEEIPVLLAKPRSLVHGRVASPVGRAGRGGPARDALWPVTRPATSHDGRLEVPRAVLLDTAHGQGQYANGAGGHMGRKPKKKSHRMPADSLIIPGEGVYMGSLGGDGKREDANGTLIYANGDVYTGNWQSDERHGTGTMSYKSTGAIYDGSWVHDTRNGHGRMKYSNGDEYSGAWEEDTKQGIGRFVWVEQGAVYEGQFQGGMIHGRGKCTCAARTRVHVPVWHWHSMRTFLSLVVPEPASLVPRSTSAALLRTRRIADVSL